MAPRPQGLSRGTAGGIAKFIAIIQGHRNFIKPHEGLMRKIPAEACGIVVEGENKWMTLIQNAAPAAK